MLWKGANDSMGPSILMGWSLRAPREVTSIQCGDGPQIKTCGNEDSCSRRQACKPASLKMCTGVKMLRHPRVSRDILKVSESGDPTFGRQAVVRCSAVRLPVFPRLWLLLSEVYVVGHLCTTKWRPKDSCHSLLTLFDFGRFSHLFEANFQVVLRLLLIVRKRFIDEQLLFNVNLNKQSASFHIISWFPTCEAPQSSESI